MRIKITEGTSGYVVGDCFHVDDDVAQDLIDKSKAVHAPVDKEGNDTDVLSEMIADYKSDDLDYSKAVSLAFQLAEDRDLEPPSDRTKDCIVDYLQEHLG